jgi:hypothetical protein
VVAQVLVVMVLAVLIQRALLERLGREVQEEMELMATQVAVAVVRGL